MPGPDRPPLAGRLAALRDRATTELDAIRRYHHDTESAWRLIREFATFGAGFGPEIQPAADAGPAINQARPELVRLSASAQLYTSRYLTEATFQQSLAVFETFVADLLVEWLTARPESLGGRDVKLIRVLRDGVEAVVAEEVSQLVLNTMTGGPRQWLDLLAQHAGVAGPPADAVARLVEAKATRDLLIHNRAVVTPAYLKKAGPLARGADGERIEMPEPYRREVWELLRQLVTDLSDAALAKLAPDLPPPAPPG